MSEAVHFTRIEVRRMPGFPRKGFAIDDLAAGVNVIYGPNASGKTTLSRAMQQLLRPHASEGRTNSLEAGLIVGGRPFELDYHMGQVTCRSGGNETAAPTLAPVELGNRYVLALHDLVQFEEEKGVVQQILREAAGGFDVTKAAGELEFHRDQPRSGNVRASSEYKAAVGKRRDAENELVDIDREAQQLESLERQRNKAHQAQLRQRVIEDAITALEKNEQLEEALDALSAFPEEMSKLTGDESERLTELNRELEEQHEDLAAANALLETAKGDLQATDLPEEGVPAELVGTLQNRCETLREYGREVTRLENELVRLKAESNDALVRLGSDVTLERAESLDSPTLDQLFKFVRQVEESRVEGTAADRLGDWLNVITQDNESPETLRDGVLLLRQWLAERRITPGRGRAKREWLVAAGITVVVSVVMAASVDPSWLALLVLAGGLTAWAFLRQRLQAAPTTVDEVSAQWGGTGLTPPTEWSPAEVQATLRRLEQKLAAALLDEEKRQRFADLEERHDDLEKRKFQNDETRQSWRNRLGLEIDVDDAHSYLLAQAIHQVQNVQSRLGAAQAELANVEERHNVLLKSINHAMAQYVDTLAIDADHAVALVHQLNQRCQNHRDALGRCGQATKIIEECDRRMEELKAERMKLYDNLSLSPDDESTLQQWCVQFPEYQQAKLAVSLAQHDKQNAFASLSGHEDLLKRTREQLKLELDECQRRANELSQLDQRIGDIRGRIDRAKVETTLEAALANEQAGLDELRTVRDNDAAQLVGNVLASYLERQLREVQQPGLLKRAAELFAGITHGRYQLLVSAGGNASEFLARDTSLGRDQNLDELSSGTRVQLLLAVRLAFVEQQEQGLKLPLIFDETLGNSDERRARKIIEAAVEIAREGRQVFYFTAQHDELGKWRRALSESDGVVHQEFDLARIREFSELEYAPMVLDFEPPPPILVPAPDGDDWRAYGRRLHVPPLDPRVHVGDVHLWYLIDDVHELHRLLSRDVNKWGQLQALVQIGSADGLDNESQVFQKASASARLLEHLLRCWRQGRGEPIDRSILEDSGAVTDKFIDDVSLLAQEHNGDARQVIEDLSAGKVQRFQTRRIDALESYLTENGYLDDQPVLDSKAIREAIMPLAFADCDNGLLSLERVEQLVALVTNTPA